MCPINLAIDVPRINEQHGVAIAGTALFTIEGELDDISGSGQTRAAHGLCSSIPAEHRQHLTAPRVGHYGIFSGRRWRESICPQVGEFIRANRQRIGHHLSAAA